MQRRRLRKSAEHSGALDRSPSDVHHLTGGAYAACVHISERI